MYNRLSPQKNANFSLFVLHSSFFTLHSTLLLLLVLAQDLDFLHERRDGVDALAVSGQVVEGEVHVEEILPLMAHDGQRLDLGQVDVVEAQDGEHLRQRPLVVGEAEDDARLVGLLDRTEESRLLGVAHHEEPREVVRIVVDAFLQHLHAIHLGCVRRADGRPPSHVVLGDIGSRACGILRLHRLEVGMVGEKLAALHQGHRMRMHFLEGAPVVLGQTADAVLDVEPVLPHHGGAALPEQLVVVEQTARDGVLDGGDSDDGRVALDVLEHLLEGGATDQLDLLSLEILMGGDVMERPQLSLYCYSLHFAYMSFTKNGPVCLLRKTVLLNHERDRFDRFLNLIS